MSTSVETVSICDRCGQTERRPGAEGAFPPFHWAAFSLHFRAVGTGWSGGGQRIDRQLCPRCADVVIDAVRADEGTQA